MVIMVNYYDKIKNKLIDNEVYERVKDYSKERNRVITYFEIGKLLNEAGKCYGKDIISLYANKLMIEVGKRYNKRTLFRIKQFSRKLLQIGAEQIKDYAENEVKQYYDNKDFKMLDVKDITKGTPKEDELFDYVNVLDQYRTFKTHLYEDDYDDYDDEVEKGYFDISL